MPLVSIDIRKGRTPAEKEQLIEALHAAFIEGLKILEHDRKYRLREYAPEDFCIPPGKSHRYVVVEATIFPGRSLEAKRRLYRAIVRNFGGLGIAPDDIFIVLHEPPMENFGISGGLPASDVKLEFEVRV